MWRRPDERQHQGVLGHRLRIGALGARPDPVVIEQSEGQDPLHAGERELHPSDIGGLRQLIGEALHLHRIEPDQGVGMVGYPDHGTAAGGDGIGGERGMVGADGDAGRSHGAHTTDRSGRTTREAGRHAGLPLLQWVVALVQWSDRYLARSGDR